MTPDNRAREEALDPARSFIVEAPAGSGKTGLLAQRYLALLSTVVRPESMVARTFTRKGAAEMKGRIPSALVQAAARMAVNDQHEQRTRELAVRALERNRKKD